MDTLEPDTRVHTDWLCRLTSLPTAAGRERRVVAWIESWVGRRPDLKLERDASGNLVIAPRDRWGVGGPPVYITAHMDHPAFVVERIVSPATVQLEFRGGVMDDFFPEAPIVIVDARDRRHAASIVERLEADGPAGKRYMADLTSGDADAVAVGDVAVWDLKDAHIDEANILHAPACDDLAAVAAALASLERLRARAADGERTEDVRLLLTRAEEIGFIGAIAACKHGTIPRGARVIALENSRAFADSPIGAGPILRVGDRVSTFSPTLTAAIAKRAEQVTGSPALPSASQKESDMAARRWQRKLMAGGACEASVFCAFGHEATCMCLPLGNYHNMAHLSELQAGTYDHRRNGPPRTDREFISVDDFVGLVDLLVAVGETLPAADPFAARIERLYADRASILEES